MGHKNDNEMLITYTLYMYINLTPHCLRLAVKGNFKCAETKPFFRLYRRKRSGCRLWSLAFKEEFSSFYLHACAIAFPVIAGKHGLCEELIPSGMLWKRPTHPL